MAGCLIQGARLRRGGRTDAAAFTLIELLVVVAIIALLIAILLPTLGKARRQTKSTICQSNLRAIGIGLANYAAEEEGVIMPFGQSGASNSQWGPPIIWKPYAPYWYQRCQQYFGGNDAYNPTNSGGTNPNLIFRCPIAKQDVTPLWDQGGFNIMYGLNANISPSGIVGSDPSGALTGTYQTSQLRKFQNIQHPLILAGDDSLWYDSTSGLYFAGKITQGRPPWPFQTYPNGVPSVNLNFEGHNHGTNVLFTDFRVEWRQLNPPDDLSNTSANEWRDRYP